MNGKDGMGEGELRKVCVMVRFTMTEMAAIDAIRKDTGLSRAAFIRMMAADRRIVAIPEVNRQEWTEMARLSANLNQLARLANSGYASEIPCGDILAVRDEVQKLRGILVAREVER